ncbi:MAG TPA: acyl-CoA dehydrogenase family protein [Tepidiformaceae bacterium]|nr:acyl-CoA dehydrogenase family protein [Tepidiformaceae bacterium]
MMESNGRNWIEVVDRIGPGFTQGAAERDAEDRFVAEHYPVLREHGLLSALVPEDLGGGGASHSDIAGILRRMAYYDSSTALALSMHQHLVGFQVFNHMNGRPAPVLARVVADQVVLVSTGARDWLESNGEARRVDGGYRVTARKAFASGSPAGAIVVTSAPFDDPADGPSVLHFAVPLANEGITLADDWRVHGMRATGSQTIVMEDVYIPEASVTLKRPRGVFAPIWNVIVGVALPLIAGVYVGVAERATEIALGLAQKRRDDPATQLAVGQMLSALAIAQACHDEAVRLTDDLRFTPSLDITSRVLMLKTSVIEHSERAVVSAMEAAGGQGFYRATGLERLLRDVRAGHYHPLPANQQYLLSGRHALGLDPV